MANYGSENPKVRVIAWFNAKFLEIKLDNLGSENISLLNLMNYIHFFWLWFHLLIWLKMKKTANEPFSTKSFGDAQTLRQLLDILSSCNQARKA